MSDVNSDVIDHWLSHRSACASKIKKCNLLVKSTNVFICTGYTHSNISYFSYQRFGGVFFFNNIAFW